MSDWKITGTSKDTVEQVVEAMSLGIAEAPTKYEVTNQESGDVKSTSAYSSDGAGKNISEGKFNKE